MFHCCYCYYCCFYCCFVVIVVVVVVVVVANVALKRKLELSACKVESKGIIEYNNKGNVEEETLSFIIS